MKCLILSDLHGNQYVLDYLRKAINYYRPDKVIFTGDVFGYYYGLKECIEFLKEVHSVCIMGNHDYYAFQVLTGRMHLLPDLVARYGKGYEQILNNAQYYRDYLMGLKKTYAVKVDGMNIVFVHGSLSNPLEGRIYPNTVINSDNFKLNDLVFAGHTHHKCIKVFKDRLWVNVGSAGQPRDGQDPTFVLYDSSNGLIQFNSIYYDKSNLIRDLEDKGDINLKHSEILVRRPIYESKSI